MIEKPVLFYIDNGVVRPVDDTFGLRFPSLVSGFVKADANGLFSTEDINTITISTKNTILQSTPSSDQVAFATDTNEFFVYDSTGGNWYKVDMPLVSDTSSPDMGYVQDSSRLGYHENYVTDKIIANSRIGGSTVTELGSIRFDTTVSPPKLEIWDGSQFNDILLDITFSDGAQELEHTPLSEAIDVWGGNSNALGLNGRPIITQYKVSMGAYPPPLIIDGGTF